MNRPFLFLSVLTSATTGDEGSVNREPQSGVTGIRPVALTTADGTTAHVRIESFDGKGMKVSYDDGRVRRVSYDAIDTIACPQLNGGIKVIAVGGELAILTTAAGADERSELCVH